MKRRADNTLDHFGDNGLRHGSSKFVETQTDKTQTKKLCWVFRKGLFDQYKRPTIYPETWQHAMLSFGLRGSGSAVNFHTHKDGGRRGDPWSQVLVLYEPNQPKQLLKMAWHLNTGCLILFLFFLLKMFLWVAFFVSGKRCTFLLNGFMNLQSWRARLYFHPHMISERFDITQQHLKKTDTQFVSKSQTKKKTTQKSNKTNKSQKQVNQKNKLTT